MDSRFDTRTSAQMWALAAEDPDYWLQRFELWGMDHGHLVQYQREGPGVMAELPKIETVLCDVVVYSSASGASDALTAARKLNESMDIQSRMLSGTGINLRELKALSHTVMGDESYMMHSKISIAGPPALGDMVQIVWRRGKVLASASWTSLNAAVFRSDVVSLAALIDRRIQAASETTH